MATGVVRRHRRDCPARGVGRCGCPYQAWVYLEREEKKVYKTFPRESEAKAWRADALRTAHRGALHRPAQDRRTLADALADLIAGMADGTVKPKGSEERYKSNTIRSYERALRLHIAPSEVGRLRVAEVRRSDVQALVDLLLATNSGKTVSNILNPMQTFYGRGVDREELALDPTDGIDLPTGKSKRPRRIVSAAEAARLLAYLPAGDRALWATAFYAGLWRGELQALRWRDVAFDVGLVRVEKGWDQQEGEIEPKSAASKRGVPLLAVLRGHLEEHLLTTNRRGDDRVFGRSARSGHGKQPTQQRGRQPSWRGVTPSY